jgi:hypothetical protein
MLERKDQIIKNPKELFLLEYQNLCKKYNGLFVAGWHEDALVYKAIDDKDLQNHFDQLNTNKNLATGFW